MIDAKYLEQTLETYLCTAIMWEVKNKRNFEMFSFKSIARIVNNLMNTSIEGRAPLYNIPNIDPDNVEILGVHPFRNKERRFQITEDEACVIANRSDYVVKFFKQP